MEEQQLRRRRMKINQQKLQKEDVKTKRGHNASAGIK